MRSPAGDHFEITHGDDPHMFRYRRCLAQGQAFQFVFIREPAPDRRVQADTFVHRLLQQEDLLLCQACPLIRHGNVDAGLRLSQVQADGRTAELFPDRPGQHMFAAVLFHMVRPPCAVDLSAHRGARGDLLVHRVDHFAAGVRFHVRHLRLGFPEGQRARIKRLPAGRGIKSAPVQRDFPFPRPLSVPYRGDFRVKLPQIRVVVIQSLCHETRSDDSLSVLHCA